MKRIFNSAGVFFEKLNGWGATDTVEPLGGTNALTS
jgi:hypothetical protein